MGQKIHALSEQLQVKVVSIIDPKQHYKEITEEAVALADLCIEFSRPEVLLSNVRKIASLKKSIVIGTTGWYHELDTVKNIILENSIAAVYAENFSIGMQIFLKIVEEAAVLIHSQPEYRVTIQEIHHNQKVDAPSGTASLLARTLSKTLQNTKEIPISSLRIGNIPGTHSVIMDSPFDTITLTHNARTRDLFAQGALQAAHLLHHQNKGFYHLRELL
jgi:4-hydroxy-tetrahydrodipicolinate reductase